MKPRFPKFNKKLVFNFLRGKWSSEGSTSSERVAAEYKHLELVSDSLAHEGLGKLNIIVGIDFTQSNAWTGEKSFDKRGMHHIGDGLNMYEQAICIIGKALAPFGRDKLIACFGFGDSTTKGRDVFSFNPGGRFCDGLEDVLSRYREIVPHVRLSEPTSFAPIIEMAMTIVKQRGGGYHVMLIIADGEVSGLHEQRTIDAIVEASHYPLSIILIGVGDDAWDNMDKFCDEILARGSDNFQFVNFTEIMSKNADTSQKETEFARTALKKIPSRYKTAIQLNLLGREMESIAERVPLPPPTIGETSFNSSAFSNSSSFRVSTSGPLEGVSQLVDTALLGLSEDAAADLVCTICYENLKQVSFDCGHQTCKRCAARVDKLSQSCPFCRHPILS